MAIVRRTERGITRPEEWDPFQVMQDMLRGWDPFRRMSAFPATLSGEGRTFVPQFEVKETKDGYVFKADLPGVKESDLDISLGGNQLTISGRREAETHDEGETFYTFERSYGSFTRTFALPESVSTDDCKADLREGVLTVTLKKRPELQPKKIAIGAGATPDKGKAKA